MSALPPKADLFQHRRLRPLLTQSGRLGGVQFGGLGVKTSWQSPVFVYQQLDLGGDPFPEGLVFLAARFLHPLDHLFSVI